MELSGMRDKLLCGMYQQTARPPVWNKEGFPLLPEVQCRGGETFAGKHDYPVLESAPEVLRLPFSSQAAAVNDRVGCCDGPIHKGKCIHHADTVCHMGRHAEVFLRSAQEYCTREPFTAKDKLGDDL